MLRSISNRTRLIVTDRTNGNNTAMYSITTVFTEEYATLKSGK